MVLDRISKEHRGGATLPLQKTHCLVSQSQHVYWLVLVCWVWHAQQPTEVVNIKKKSGEEGPLSLSSGLGGSVLETRGFEDEYQC